MKSARELHEADSFDTSCVDTDCVEFPDRESSLMPNSLLQNKEDCGHRYDWRWGIIDHHDTQ